MPHTLIWTVHIYGLVQDWSNSIANALKLLQDCTKPSMFQLNPRLPEDIDEYYIAQFYVDVIQQHNKMTEQN